MSATRSTKRVTGSTLLLVAALAVGCVAPDGQDAAGATTRGLAELQAAMTTGNPPSWYTEKLAQLDFEVKTLRYERNDLLAYDVVKGPAAFHIVLELDPQTATASRVEIEPATPAAVTADEPVHPEVSPAPVAVVALPAGTLIATRLNDPLDSGTAQVGDRFSMMVPEAVSLAGITVLPAGSRIRGYVAEVQKARRPNAGGRLTLKADVIEADGASVEFEGLVTAEGERLEGEGSVREDLKEIAVGAGVGGLVGGLLGGGKGVVAGILIGGGGTFVATKGEEVRLSPDTSLYVELREEVTVPVGH